MSTIERITPQGITKEEFTAVLKFIANGIPHIEGKPLYTTVHQLRKVVKKKI